MAFLIGKFNVFEYIDRKLQISSGISGLICFLLIIVRFTYTVHPSQNSGDIIIAPLLIFFIVKRICFEGGSEERDEEDAEIYGEILNIYMAFSYFLDILLFSRYYIIAALFSVNFCVGAFY